MVKSADISFHLYTNQEYLGQEIRNTRNGAAAHGRPLWVTEEVLNHEEVLHHEDVLHHEEVLHHDGGRLQAQGGAWTLLQLKQVLPPRPRSRLSLITLLIL